MILKRIVLFCLEIFFTITNSEDSDEMQHHAAFHLGLHCLQKYSFRGLRIQLVANTLKQIIAFRQ